MVIIDPKILPIHVAKTIVVITIERFIAGPVESVMMKVNVSFKEKVPARKVYSGIFFKAKLYLLWITGSTAGLLHLIKGIGNAKKKGASFEAPVHLI